MRMETHYAASLLSTWRGQLPSPERMWIFPARLTNRKSPVSICGGKDRSTVFYRPQRR